MHVELTRMITAWLGHADYGVNTLVKTVPRNKIGSGKDPLPPKVEIYNDVDWDVVADTRTLITPPTTPSLVVVSDMLVREDEPQPQKSGREVPNCQVGIGYYAEPGYREAAIIAGDYTLRAVFLSLRRYHGEQANGYRELNGIRAARITRLEMERVVPNVQSTLLGLVFAQVLVLDKLP